jgi:hypothetical protein
MTGRQDLRVRGTRPEWFRPLLATAAAVLLLATGTLAVGSGIAGAASTGGTLTGTR